MNRPILRRKLTPPPPWDGAIARPRLEAALERALGEGRHVVLCAGTGYGKTSLLADWARRHDGAWLTLDAEDADLDAFLAYLIAACERALPGFATEARTMLGRARDRDGAIAALSALIADLDEQCDRPLLLVLDDYHLAASPTLDTLVARLMKYLPEPVRLVLAARKPPEVELAARRARRELLLLDEPELAFDADELGRLRPGLGATALQSLLQATGGWPAAMGMTAELLDANQEEQLLLGQSPETRACLLRLALLDAIDPVLCEAALGMPLTPELVAGLRRDRLLFPLGTDQYVLHPALRSMLRRRLDAELGIAGRQALLRRVGDHYWQTSQTATALRFWIDAGQAAWAAERLVEVAEDWLAQGRLEALASTLGALGEEADRPALLMVQGELHRRWGDFARADAVLARAVEALGPAPGPLERAIARLRQAQVAASRGGVAEARAFLAEAAPALAGEPRYRVDVLIVEGGLALLSGDTEAAIRHFEATRQAGQRLGDPYAEARAIHNLGVCYTRLGEFDRALASYDAAMRPTGPDGTPAVWMTPINRALVLVQLDRAAEARDAAEAALALVRRYRLTREEGYALRILGYAQLRVGDFTQAAACFESAERQARLANDALGLAYSLNFAAELAVMEGDAAAAERLSAEVEQVVGGPEAFGNVQDFVQVRAKVHLLAGRPHEARALVDLLLERARRLGYKHLLAETEQLEREVQAAEAGRPARGHAHAQPAESEPPALTIRCFGPLRVARPDGEITDKEWQTTRAKQLFAFLLFTPDGATKATLLGSAFPREEVSNDLMNMTLMRLRKALEPELGKGQPSRFILRQDGRYLFNRQIPVALDTRDFEQALKAARLAEDAAEERAGLERALALYAGDFLAGQEDDWVVGLRHGFQDQALAACRRLLAIYEEAAPERVIDLLRRALEVDPVSEEFNRELILRYLEAAEPHRAVQHYRLVQQRFKDLLDAEPPADLALLVAGK
jgi:ATP/maltotriose-dependent transcriptional regulator MalT/DNA-binding SARP family transcriptional activator